MAALAALKPTEEQERITDGSQTGRNMVIQAGAGTGKTSTLNLISRVKKDKGILFVAYNRAIKDDATKKFPVNVQCMTSHGLAYHAVGKEYSRRLKSPRQTSRDAARILGIYEPERVSDRFAPLAPQQLARITLETLKRFCYSADDRIGRMHVPFQDGLEMPEQQALAKVIVEYAQRAWDKEIRNKDGQLRFEHDYYLKMWALKKPQLDMDLVLLDEAQDSNPCVAGVIMGQRNTQVILVGDSAQSIYLWRGAQDAMADFAGDQYLLTQSFRFGPAVAGIANKWLSMPTLNAPLRLRGFDKIPSVLAALAAPDAVLCRTNAGAIREVMKAFDEGYKPALVGGAAAIKRLAEAALDLKAGRPTSHPELYLFPTWAMVQDYAEYDGSGSDLKSFVKLIDDYGPDVVIDLCDRLSDARYANRIITTAHKAKGLEWPKVRIADDFREPTGTEDNPDPQVSKEDAMLAYVSVTRAQQVLDQGGLAWVDKFLPGAPRVAKPARVAAKERETLVIAMEPPALDADPLESLKAEEQLAVAETAAPAPVRRRTRRSLADTRHLLYGDTPIPDYAGPVTEADLALTEVNGAVLDSLLNGKPLPAPKSTCTCDPAAAKRTADLLGMECGPDVPRCHRCGGGRQGVAMV